MSARRLVIIGNGMAGARRAEHLLTAPAADRFDIVMVGDEPGGCYNRILLSGVLAGAYADATATPIPTINASTTDSALSAIAPGRLLT